jgi:hypothetical protein
MTQEVNYRFFGHKPQTQGNKVRFRQAVEHMQHKSQTLNGIGHDPSGQDLDDATGKAGVVCVPGFIPRRCLAEDTSWNANHPRNDVAPVRLQQNGSVIKETNLPLSEYSNVQPLADDVKCVVLSTCKRHGRTLISTRDA